MTVVDTHLIDGIEQGTTAWHDLRRGKVTASRVADVIAKTKSGWGAGRKNYMAELVAERLTGTTAERFTNAAMQWGTDTEPQARAAYEFFNDAEVEQVPFIIHPSIEQSGASPDGLVGDIGMLEVKCPNTATHIETLLSGKVPAKYVTQMQWQMACAQRDWCDFVSYDPRLPENLRLFMRREIRDDALVDGLQSMVVDFLDELKETITRLEELNEIQQRQGMPPETSNDTNVVHTDPVDLANSKPVF